jgi:hypothetical protein
MLPKAHAESVLADAGYENPALVPSTTYVGGWSGTATKNGVKVRVAVDRNGNPQPI